MPSEFISEWLLYSQTTAHIDNKSILRVPANCRCTFCFKCTCTVYTTFLRLSLFSSQPRPQKPSLTYPHHKTHVCEEPQGWDAYTEYSNGIYCSATTDQRQTAILSDMLHSVYFKTLHTRSSHFENRWKEMIAK